MTDNIKEMYERARRAFEVVESWPQEKADEMALAGVLSTHLLYREFVAKPTEPTALNEQDDVKEVRRLSVGEDKTFAITEQQAEP